MINVVCAHCGITGTSKNPYTRSIFYKDQGLATAEGVLPCVVNDLGGGRQQIVLKKMIWGSKVETLQSIIEILQDAINCDQVDQFLCDHSFHPATDEDRENMLVS